MIAAMIVRAVVWAHSGIYRREVWAPCPLNGMCTLIDLVIHFALGEGNWMTDIMRHGHWIVYMIKRVLPTNWCHYWLTHLFLVKIDIRPQRRLSHRWCANIWVIWILLVILSNTGFLMHNFTLHFLNYIWSIQRLNITSCIIIKELASIFKFKFLTQIDFILSISPWLLKCRSLFITMVHIRFPMILL